MAYIVKSVISSLVMSELSRKKKSVKLWSVTEIEQENPYST